MLDDNIILGVSSPKKDVDGPYAIVVKGENWAIVVFEFQDTPSLGIRWFHTPHGMPTVRGNIPVWYRIPAELNDIIINGLNIDPDNKKIIKEYLDKKINSEQLKQNYKS